MSRFDYVRYDALSTKKQEIFKALFEQIEKAAHDLLDDGRYKSLFFAALEEAYMWTGKVIRDNQRTRVKSPHDIKRSNA